MRQKLTFDSQGHTLAGLLETPDEPPRAYVLFAHCFTCGKDIAAASRISRFLVRARFAVFRFDFTGLGNSDGDFANTNFSTNTQDLVAAARYLEATYEAPRLLIGHSLGGTAVLQAAAELPKVDAVVTIGAPFEADHVLHNFHADLSQIETQGQAEVSLGGRCFTIRRQFIDDVRAQSTETIGALDKALLVMHSPLDTTVDIREAEKIYGAAKHPKSFISLDRADHLLSQEADSEYAAQAIAGWASRYVTESSTPERPDVPKGHVVVSEMDHRFQQSVYSDHHHWYADEPIAMGGQNGGPDPYEHLLAALGTCTAMTLRMYATRKKLRLDHVEVSLFHERNYVADADQAEQNQSGVERLVRRIYLQGELTAEQRQKLLEIADKCPVHRTLHNDPVVQTELVESR
ncbi:bifunctional alpha/beta hydrolase/OsmC family protein [Reinekea blandensis]|uniref:Serine aminopeptidase S33 domain-containing protein n=1 Tax=Reinekea blandensis MED297 TaxID=314283 RepID=A4BIE8_9GAMM|nr:bifunctional alpha/beta hydrolase/OsmC family protein [Reinekea blandensis]EAR08155.1 hypothetical protein MED297_00665 [Reinekea sp. MED297] [Reinekea blandensis MED297]